MMKNRPVGFLALALLLPMACSAAPGDERTASTTEPIEHGDLDDGDATTVALTRDGDVFCSGTLVGRRAVVTAAHCVVYRRPDGILFAPSRGTPAAVTADVSSVTVHPSFDPAILSNDLAIVVLAADAPLAAPARIEHAAPGSGTTIRVVGFGAPRGSHEVLGRRVGTALVGEVDATTFESHPDPGQPCSNDSGGSAYQDDGNGPILFGVVSGGDADCARYARFTRLGPYLDFLAPYVQPGTVGGGGGCAIRPERDGDASSPLPLAVLAVTALIHARWRRKLSGTRLAVRSIKLSSSSS